MSKPIKKSSKNKVILGALALIFVVSSLFLAMFAVRTKTNIAPKAAVMANASNLVLSTKKRTVAKGQNFVVDVNLANDQDMEYVVTGVDAIISYDPQVLEAIKITKGPVFNALSNETIKKSAGKVNISGSYSNIKDEKGYPKGYNGNGGTIATISFKAKKVGDAKLSFVYRGGQATGDSNIIAFKRDQLVSAQMPQERFLRKPVNLAMKIVLNQPTPTPAPLSNRCEPCSGSLPPSAPNSRCAKGLVCEYEVSTMGPKDGVTNEEGNVVRPDIVGASGLCVKAGETVAACQSIKPIKCNDVCTKDSQCSSPNVANNWFCSFNPKDGLVGACRSRSNPSSKTCEGGVACTEDAKKCPDGSYVSRVAPNCEFAKCPVPRPTPTLIPTPTPRPRPEAKIQIKLNSLAVLEERDRPGTDSKIKGVLYGVEVNKNVTIYNDNVKGVMVASELGDINREFDARPVSTSVTKPGFVNDLGTPRLVKIGEFTVGYNSPVVVTIPQRLEGKRMQLFVRTQSHLRKAGNKIVMLPRVLDCMWKGSKKCYVALSMPAVEFNNLIPGDIYVAGKQAGQDNIINTFDALELISSFGEQPIMMANNVRCLKEPCGDPRQVFVLNKADLNADLVVNVRDLKILMRNFDKRGARLPVAIPTTAPPRPIGL